MTCRATESDATVMWLDQLQWCGIDRYPPSSFIKSCQCRSVEEGREGNAPGHDVGRVLTQHSIWSHTTGFEQRYTLGIEMGHIDEAIGCQLQRERGAHHLCNKRGSTRRVLPRPMKCVIAADTSSGIDNPNSTRTRRLAVASVGLLSPIHAPMDGVHLQFFCSKTHVIPVAKNDEGRAAEVPIIRQP